MVPVAGTSMSLEPSNYGSLFRYYRKLERILASFIANISPVIRHFFGRLNRPPGGRGNELSIVIGSPHSHLKRISNLKENEFL